MLVSDLYWTMPCGTVPSHPGPVTTKVCAPVPVVRLPGTSNTVVHPSSKGNSAYRSCMSGRLTTQGSSPTSKNAVVYRVSAFGAVTSRNLASGYSRNLISCPMGARVPTGDSTLVMTLRVISIVTRG
ncbi:hypothetical protein D3C71_1507650 [compost metagenome]